MSQTASQLIDEIDTYEEMHPDGDIDLAAQFSDKVRAFGDEELVVYLFRNYSDSGLSYRLSLLKFVWSKFSYETWLRILERLSDDRRLVYFFLMFASGTLAWHISRLEDVHPNVSDALQSSAFRTGFPKPMSRTTRASMGDDFDYESVWKKLQAEGAPMQDWVSE